MELNAFMDSAQDMSKGMTNDGSKSNGEHIFTVEQHNVEDSKALPLDDEMRDDWDDDPDTEEIKYSRFDCLAIAIATLQKWAKKAYSKTMRFTRGHLIFAIFLLAYTAYFIYAMIHEFGSEESIRLLVCTIIGFLIITRHIIHKGLVIVMPSLNDKLNPSCVRWTRLVIRWFLYFAAIGFIVWTIYDNSDNSDSMRPLPGLFIMLILCLLVSYRPSRINWHTVFWGLAMQFIFSVCAFRYSFGRDAIQYLTDRLSEFFDHSKRASTLLFGPVTKDHTLIFESFPIAFMIAAFIGALYYLGAMQLIIKVVGSVLSFIMDTETVESTSVASSIFLDGPAAVLALKPYLEYQSKSQLFLIITSCFSSLGGTYLAILSAVKVDLKFVIPAMLISAPATFAVCKIFMPETRPKDCKRNKPDFSESEEKTEGNLLTAFQMGALIGLPLMGNIVAISFAFESGIGFLNSACEWFGERVGKDGLTMEYILSYLLYPIAFAMGVHPDECHLGGRLLGIRFLSSNFLSFLEMLPLRINRLIYMEYMRLTNFAGPVLHHGDDLFLVGMNTTLKGGYITERTEVIMTFSLCGFSSVPSMANIMAVLLVLVPKRRVWMTKIALAALLAGNIANFMTGCLAALFYEE